MGVHRFILPLSSIPLSSASFFSLRTITNSSSKNVSERRCLGLGCCRWDGGGGGGGGGNGGLDIYGEGVRVQCWRSRDGRLMTRIIENGFIVNIFFFEEWTASLRVDS